MTDLAIAIQSLVNQSKIKGMKMGAASVTGPGRGETISPSKLIGPRWDETREKEFQTLKRQMKGMITGFLFVSSALLLMLITLLMIAYLLNGVVK
jgi:hypothetical protein